MYKSNLVVCVKVDGKILRERGNRVAIPFGSEYTILIKNLDTRRRVSVDIEVDGESITGNGLIVNANSETDLKRKVSSSDSGTGNSFKFIQMNSAIEAHRGIKAMDGLMKVSFQYEVEFNLTGSTGSRRVTPSWKNSPYPMTNTFPRSNEVFADSTTFGNALSAATTAERGITVPGSLVEQTFTTTSFIPGSIRESFVIELVGGVDAPVTVQRRVACTTCGSAAKQTDKFCSQCGTSLEYV